MFNIKPKQPDSGEIQSLNRKWRQMISMAVILLTTATGCLGAISANVVLSDESLQDINKMSEADLTLTSLLKLPEYIRTYRTLKGHYDELHEATEILRQELESTLRLIQLKENNLGTMQELWRIRQRAWARIYQIPDTERKGAQDEKKLIDEVDAGESQALQTDANQESSAEQPNPSGGGILRRWQVRIRTLLSQYNQLVELNRDMQAQLGEARQRLLELEEQAEQMTDHMESTARAWRRIYKE